MRNENIYHYRVTPQESINYFIYSEIETVKIMAPIETMEAQFSSDEGYFDIDYPVRKNYLKDVVEKLPNSFPREGYNNIYTPFESDVFDLSSFISTPHQLKCFAKCYIKSESNKEVLLRFKTCGGMKIWLNDKNILEFLPYTRNHLSEMDLQCFLNEGENEIVIYFEDLAERDVNYLFQIQNLDDDSLNCYIPLKDISEEEYRKSKELLYALSFSKDTYNEEDIFLEHPDLSIDEKINLVVKINPPTYLANSSMQDGNITDFKVNDFILEIKPNTDKTFVAKISDIPTAGLTKFQMQLTLSNGQIISRKLNCSIYNEEKFSKIIQGKELIDRKKEALRYFAELDLDDINVALSRIVLGEEVEGMREEFKSAFNLISQKGDCADFVLTPLLAIYTKYQHNFPENMDPVVKDLSLDFRYWVDEPGNDVMWYFSENHALLFHVSQYLAGNLYSNEIFKVSNRIGKQHYELGKERLRKWFEEFFKYGFSEWNSTTYLPIDFIGFFSLAIAAPDEEIVSLAQKALDYTFELIAINYQDGTMASTYGRVYEHNLKAMKLGEISSVCKIAWGKGFFNNALRASSLFAISDYVPKESLNEILDSSTSDLIAFYKQGENQASTYLMKSQFYSMASVQEYRYKEKGHQQHVMNIALGDCVNIWLNAPGESEYSGEGRPSFWAGNSSLPQIIQYRNIQAINYELSEDDLSYIHLYLPFWELDEIIIEKRQVYLRRGHAYVGIFFDNNIELSTESAIRNREIRSYGKKHQVVVKCGSSQEYSSFSEFKELTKELVVFSDFNNIQLRDSQFGEINGIKELIARRNEELESPTFIPIESVIKLTK